MRIAIFSDPHCGFTEKGREEDCFKALEEAMRVCKTAQLILIAGDIFDTRVPKQDVFARVARILLRAHMQSSDAKLVEFIGKDKSDFQELVLRGIPIIAIHGNHERRSRQLINPVQALEHAGILINLHCACAVFEINGTKVAIHGMGAVPERYARDVFLEWRPKPVKDAINILMLHQSIGDYIYSPLEPPTLRLEDLPDGFDLYVLGHLHYSELRDFKSGKLLLPGSLIPTVPRKDEAMQKKGVWFFDGKNVELTALRFQRKIYFKEFEYTPDVKERIKHWLKSLEEGSIVYVKVKGKSKEGCTVSFRDILNEFENRLILKLKVNVESEEFTEKVKVIELVKENRLSPEDLGMEMFRKNLVALNCSLKPEDLFELLVSGDVETAFSILKGEQTKISEFDKEENEKTQTHEVRESQQKQYQNKSRKDGLFSWVS